MEHDKQQAALNAAQDQFLRYGFRRVTMGDIATAAGMSRPALYLLFPNKEALFNGVFERFVNASLAEIEAGINDFSALAEQLAFALEIWTIRPFELLYDTPEGRELAECNYEFTAALKLKSYTRFEAIIRDVFAQHLKRRRLHGMDPAALAQLLVHALPGMKAGAKDATHLRTLVTNLINLAAAAVNTKSASRHKPARAGKS